MKKSKPAKKIKEAKKVNVDELLKEKSDVENMISFLETDYRKANISEKSYSELKYKHMKKLEEIDAKLKSGGLDLKQVQNEKKDEPVKKEAVEEEKKEPNKEEKVEQEPPKEVTEEKPKLGFFKKIKIFGKKEEKPNENKVEQEEVKKEEPAQKDKKDEKKEEEDSEEGPKFVDPLKPPPDEQPRSVLAVASAGEEGAGTGNVEIEKLRVMIDAIRETGHSTDETIRTLSEGIGEIRSMVFQADATLRENMAKMEKIEDDISEIKPQEIAKKFRETNETIEKHQIIIEKLEKKTEDLAEKINKVYDMLKSIGNIENLSGISKEVQKKLDDINEAVRYIERIGSKTEKIFIDLNKGLEDFAVLKSKQEDLDESLKDIIKSIDGLNVKFEGYVSKKDLESFKEDDLLIKKQIEEINKVLPLVQVKLSESIINLRKDRDDILMFMDSVGEQVRAGKMSKEEYENVKESNAKKLKEIDEKLMKEWGKIDRLIKTSDKEKVETPEAQKERPEETVEENKEEPKEEVTEVKEEEENPEEIETEEKLVEKPAIEKPKPADRIEKHKIVSKPFRVAKNKIEIKTKKPKVAKKKSSVLERKKKILNELKKIKI